MLTGEMVVDFDRANSEAEEAELLHMLESGGHEKHLKVFKRLVIHREILEDVLRKACNVIACSGQGDTRSYEKILNLRGSWE